MQGTIQELVHSLGYMADKFGPPLAAHLTRATRSAADHDGFHFETDGIAVDLKYDDVNDPLAGGNITIVIDNFEYIIDPLAIFGRPKSSSLKMTLTANYQIQKGKSIKVNLKSDIEGLSGKGHIVHITQVFTFSAIKKDMWQLELKNLPVSTFYLLKPFNASVEFCNKCIRGQIASEDLNVDFNGTFVRGQSFEITMNLPLGLKLEIALDNDGNQGTVSLSCTEGPTPATEGLLGDITYTPGKKFEITGTSGACFLPMDFIFEMSSYREVRNNETLFTMSLSSNRRPNLNFKLEAKHDSLSDRRNLQIMNTQVMLSAGQPSQVLFSLEYQVNMDTSRKLSLTSGDLRKSLILRKLLGYEEISNDKDRTVGLEFLYDEIDNYKYQIMYKRENKYCCGYLREMRNTDFYNTADRIEQRTILTLAKKNAEQAAIVVSQDQSDLNPDTGEANEINISKLTLDRCENDCVKGSFTSIDAAHGFVEHSNMTFEGNQSPGEILTGPLLEKGRRYFQLFWWVDKGRELYAQVNRFVQPDGR